MAFDLLHGKSAVGFIGGLLYGWLAVGGRYSLKEAVRGKLSARPHHAAATTGSRAALRLKEPLSGRIVNGDDSAPASDQLSCLESSLESQLRCTSKACPAVGEQPLPARRSMPCIARDAACKPLAFSGEHAYHV